MTTIPTLEELKRFDTSHDLILSLTLYEEIIQFNKESERFTGFTRDEVLHKKLSEVLIPKESTSLWKNVFDSIRHDLWIDTFVLPIRTKDDRVHMVTWTGFLVKDEHGSVKDICIFGKPLESQPIDQPVSIFPVLGEQPKSASSIPLDQPKRVLSQSVIQEKELTKPHDIQIEIPPSPLASPSGEQSKDSVPQPVSEEKKPEKHPEIRRIPPSSISDSLPGEPSNRRPPQMTIPQKKPEKLPEIPIDSHSSTSPLPLPPGKRGLQVRHGVNKMLFAHEKRKPVEHSAPVEEKKAIPLEVLTAQPLGVPTQKLELLHDSLLELLEKYETVCKRVAELEKRDQQSRKTQEQQGPSHPPHRDEPNTLTTKPNDIEIDASTTYEQDDNKEKSSFHLDPFGFKRQHAELDLKQQQIELRSKELEAFEARLLRQENALKARIEEFSKWQEKLMLLEYAIEKRRQELMKQENFDLGKEPVPAMMNTASQPGSTVEKASSPEFVSNNEETLEKISQSAAIVQRGIVKQVNTLFIEFLGYSSEEILEKSYFDFIALEGLADVEKYYLDRLKGEGVSMYRTVFSTKNNSKVPAEVNIKQTIFNGEKAEIAIVTCVKTPTI